MATFSAATFSSARYASFRPTYPHSLFTEFLLPYHRGPRNVLVDLGCGPGTVTRPLSAYFARTIGTDPSPGMLETAQSLTPSEQYPLVTYRAAAAEKLDFLADGEADMVVAAQAAHWFSPSSWWAEMARAVRPQGTVAVWGYQDIQFPRFPRASRVLRDYMYAQEKLGPYWSQPGRSIVEGRLRAIRPPEGSWEEVLRWEYEPEFEGPSGGEAHVRNPVLENDGQPGFGRLVNRGKGLMRRSLKLGDVESYIRTWSCIHAWEVEHGKNLAEGGKKGDIVDEIMMRMAEAERWGEEWRELQVEIAWGHGVVLARRK